jgi:hypothetical protein
MPEDIDMVFGATDFGHPSQVRRPDLLRAIDNTLKRMEEEAEYLPYTYLYKIDEGICADERPATGMTSGIRMNDDPYYYAIDSGLGYCYLEKMAVDENGKGCVVDKIDIHDLRSIKTDNCGEIKIFRAKKKITLARYLQGLREFLSNQEEEIVQKTLG